MYKFIIFFFILSIFIFSQDYSNPKISAIPIGFNIEMDMSTVYNKNNYILRDISYKKYEIYFIGEVTQNNKKFLYIFCEKLDTTKSYTVELWNIKDSKGNIIDNNHNRMRVAKIF